MLIDSFNIVGTIEDIKAQNNCGVCDAISTVAKQTGRPFSTVSSMYYAALKKNKIAGEDAIISKDNIVKYVDDIVKSKAVSLERAFVIAAMQSSRSVQSVRVSYARGKSALSEKPKAIEVKPVEILKPVIESSLSKNYVEVLILRHKMTEDMAIAKAATDLKIPVKLLVG